MENIFKLFKKLGESSIANEGFVSFNLRLDKPLRLEYTIKSFLDERHYTDKKVFKKKLDIFHGIESNYSYTMHGDIEYPEEFKSKKCELSVNPLGGSDYLDYGCKGHLGDGWYENDCFFFRLYISPQMAKDIIDRRIIAEHFEDDYREYDDWIWEKLRIDVSDYRLIPTPFSHNSKRIWFYIVQVYC